MIRIKRVYEEPASGDGHRFFVDHLWPRGLRKENVEVESWLKTVAPSDELRKWFGHDPARWAEFKRRYVSELKRKPESWEELARAAKQGDVTLVYGARDTEHNNALVLSGFLKDWMKQAPVRGGRKRSGTKRKTRG